MEEYKNSPREIINEIENNNGMMKVENTVRVNSEEKSNRIIGEIHEEIIWRSLKIVYTPGCSTAKKDVYNNTLERNYSQDNYTISDLDKMEDSDELSNVVLSDNDNAYKKIDDSPKRYAEKSIHSTQKRCNNTFATHRPDQHDLDK